MAPPFPRPYRCTQVVLLRHQLLPRCRQCLKLLELPFDPPLQLLTWNFREAVATRAFGEDLSPRVLRPGAVGM